MNKKSIIAVVIALLIIGGLSYWALTNSEDQTSTSPQATEQSEQSEETAEPESEIAEAAVAEGRYEDYSESELSAEGYDTNIIFFHAPWCPECRAFEKEILAGTMPNGVQILKADYDSETDLKKQYGVTQQTTFVKVDDGGNEISQWSGYGESKSIDAILDNLN